MIPTLCSLRSRTRVPLLRAPSQHEFVGALVRLAHYKYGQTNCSLTEGFGKLMHSAVEPHVSNDLQLESDPFSEVMRHPSSRSLSGTPPRAIRVTPPCTTGDDSFDSLQLEEAAYYKCHNHLCEGSASKW